MKELKLGGKLGMIALVDDEDYERVSKHKWHPNKSTMKNGTVSTWYAQGSPSHLLLHRFILGITDPKIHVDHKDRNGLNNQKSNLRIGTRSQNLANRPKARLNTSGFKGVYRSQRLSKPWTAIISHNNKERCLGVFLTREEAAHAYDKAAIEQWGEFAYLNFPENKGFLARWDSDQSPSIAVPPPGSTPPPPLSGNESFLF